MQVRTDLAEEAQALWRQSAGKTTQLEGVKARSWEEHGVGRHQVQILNEQGEKALGKPRGTYETLWVPGDGRPTPEAAEALGEAVRDLLDLRGGESVLVVGLGNRAMTPDAVGPLSAGGILVTRHLRQQLPQIFAGVRPVSAQAFWGLPAWRARKLSKVWWKLRGRTGSWWWTPWRLAARTGFAG